MLPFTRLSETERLVMSTEIEDIRKLLEINESDLNGEFIRLPATMARWGTITADAAYDVSMAKQAYEKECAKVSEELRAKSAAAAEGNRRPTVDQINAQTTNALTVLMKQDALFEAERKYRRNQGIVEALRTKRDMLVQLGASYRAQMESDPGIRSRGGNRREEDSPRRPWETSSNGWSR